MSPSTTISTIAVETSAASSATLAVPVDANAESLPEQALDADESPGESGGTSPLTDMAGALDMCGPTWITGWMHDRLDFTKRLQFLVLCDGVPVGGGVADLFRKDLLDANFGDGKCGFKVLMPEALLDGKSHEVEIREVETGFLLPGSPQTIEAGSVMRGEIVLDGAGLRGFARLPDTGIDIEELHLVENGEIIGVGRGWHDEADFAVAHFHVPLPHKVFDGRPHAFFVRTMLDSVTLGSIALVMPYHLTPEAALLQYAREGMKPALAVAAGFRYAALGESLKRLADVRAEDSVDGLSLRQQIAQLERVHARLVRGFRDTDKDFAPLVFPRPAQPRASVVIPVHNKFHVTYHCLLSLLLAANRASFEVILVDDGSSDDSTRVPELIEGIEYLRNEEAQGFIRACNRGATLARGEYIVMLNNDTEVTSGWIDELLWTFEHFDNVGMAGAKLLYPNGTLQEAGGVVWNNGNPWNYGRQANPHDPKFCYARQTDYLSGACVMLPTALWKEIGGFSENYVPAYFEDTDLAFQVRDRGYKTVYAPYSQVIHFEGISSGTSVTSGTKRYQEINRPKFKSRWIGACRNNGKEGVDLEINKDRNVEFRVLVIDAETPMPDQNAGSYAAIQEMRMLQALGFKCTFVPQNMAYMGRYTENLQRMGIECVYAPFASNLDGVIESRGREFDLVYITRYYVAQQCVAKIRQHAPQAKIVLMNADLHFLRELREALNSGKSDDIARAVVTRDEELQVMRSVDLVLSYTDVEKAVILSHNLESSNVARCPWVCETVDEVAPFEERRDVAFLGGYNHAPNVDAVQWFAQKVMPLLRETLPGVRFRVYGSNVPPELVEFAAQYDDVVIDGWVADVAEVYDTCRVFIAPLQSGAGIKGKVIGALAHGVPCVLSQVAAEGIPVGDGLDAAIGGTPEEWAAWITRIYQDSGAWATMSEHARQFARRRYGMEKGVEDMRVALQQAEFFTSTDNRTLAYR